MATNVKGKKRQKKKNEDNGKGRPRASTYGGADKDRDGLATGGRRSDGRGDGGDKGGSGGERGGVGVGGRRGSGIVNAAGVVGGVDGGDNGGGNGKESPIEADGVSMWEDLAISINYVNSTAPGK